MRKVCTINQKDLEHIALSLLVGGCVAAQTNHLLPVRTERAIIARAVPVQYCTTQYAFLQFQYGFFLEFVRLALTFRCSQTACLSASTVPDGRLGSGRGFRIGFETRSLTRPTLAHPPTATTSTTHCNNIHHPLRHHPLRSAHL
jgi:hypothetical protein